MVYGIAWLRELLCHAIPYLEILTGHVTVNVIRIGIFFPTIFAVILLWTEGFPSQAKDIKSTHLCRDVDVPLPFIYTIQYRLPSSGM